MAESNITTFSGRRCTRVPRTSRSIILSTGASAPSIASQLSSAIPTIASTTTLDSQTIPASSSQVAAPIIVPAGAGQQQDPDIVSISNVTPSAASAASAAPSSLVSITSTPSTSTAAAGAAIPQLSQSPSTGIVITPISDSSPSSVAASLFPTPSDSSLITQIISPTNPSTVSSSNDPTGTGLPAIGTSGNSKSDPPTGQSTGTPITNRQRLPVGAIAGGVVGGLVGAIMLSLLILWCLKRRRNRVVAESDDFSTRASSRGSPVMIHSRRASRSFNTLSAAIAAIRKRPRSSNTDVDSNGNGSGNLEAGRSSIFPDKAPSPDVREISPPSTSYTERSMRSTGPLTLPWLRRDRDRQENRPSGTPATDNVENPFSKIAIDPFRDPTRPLTLRLTNPDILSRLQTPQSPGSSAPSGKRSMSSELAREPPKGFNLFKDFSNVASAAFSPFPNKSGKQSRGPSAVPSRRTSLYQEYTTNDPFADPVPGLPSPLNGKEPQIPRIESQDFPSARVAPLGISKFGAASKFDPNSFPRPVSPGLLTTASSKYPETPRYDPNTFPMPQTARLPPKTAASSRYPSMVSALDSSRPQTRIGSLDLGRGFKDDFFNRPSQDENRITSKAASFLDSPALTPQMRSPGRVDPARKMRGVSDPFDLDRPEILGYGAFGVRRDPSLKKKPSLRRDPSLRR